MPLEPASPSLPLLLLCLLPPPAAVFCSPPLFLCLLTTPAARISEADIWLNDPEVRKAIHAAPQDVTGPWQLCSDRIFYTANGGSMLPVHNFLVREAGAPAAAERLVRGSAPHSRKTPAAAPPRRI